MLRYAVKTAKSSSKRRVAAAELAAERHADRVIGESLEAAGLVIRDPLRGVLSFAPDVLELDPTASVIERARRWRENPLVPSLRGRTRSAPASFDLVEDYYTLYGWLKPLKDLALEDLLERLERDLPSLVLMVRRRVPTRPELEILCREHRRTARGRERGTLTTKGLALSLLTLLRAKGDALKVEEEHAFHRARDTTRRHLTSAVALARRHWNRDVLAIWRRDGLQWEPTT